MRSHAVLLIEASPLFRDALVSVLHQLGYSVTTCHLADRQASEGKQPLLVLLDVATFAGGLEDLGNTVERYSRAAPLLLLGREDRIEEVVAGLKAGALGFVRQTASKTELQDAIRAVASGRAYCDSTIFRRIMKLLPGIGYLKETKLTKREQDVLRYLALGQANKEIAQNLTLSVQAIKVHVSNLLRKTGAPNRGGLTLYAVTHGFTVAHQSA